MECKEDYTAQNIRVFIDGDQILFKVTGVGGDDGKLVELTPLDPNFRVNINSYTGRTFEVQIITPNWPLKESDSKLVCRSINQVNRFMHVSALPGIDDCTMFTNKINITIPPLPPNPFYSIIMYFGKRGDIDCDYRFRVSFPTRINAVMPECRSRCLTEFVDIPAKQITELRTDTGVRIPIPNFTPVKCQSGGTNNSIENLIREAILDYAQCDSLLFTVNLEPSRREVDCMRLTLNKSPVKIRKIRVGGYLYDFNIQEC